MELLLSIQDQPCTPTDFREAARAVLFDENNLIPLLFVSEHNYHKLPGGGIDEGEDRMIALKREILEETGCEAEIGQEIGKIEELRSKWTQHQMSYCYLGKVLSKGEASLEAGEIADGFQLVWMSLDDAIAQVERDEPQSYVGSQVPSKSQRDP